MLQRCEEMLQNFGQAIQEIQEVKQTNKHE